MSKVKLVATVAAALLIASMVTQVLGLAEECDPKLCNGPECRCSSTSTPGDLSYVDTPQFVVLSFDDGVTITNFPFYEDLSTFKNPNDCPVKMTFFTSHENSDYTLINKLHRKGHEISTHSVSHKPDIEHYWQQMTAESWTNEMVDMKTMLNQYGKIPLKDIKGFRVPFLEVGGDLMYETLSANNFSYDCSWPTRQYTPWYVNEGEDEPRGALWPYTLDYLSIQEQTVGTKPLNSFPGMWVNPMTDMVDNRDVECAMLDMCLSMEDELETSSEAVTEMLKTNFKYHYYTSRTPFGLYTHHSWFNYDVINNQTVRMDGFKGFLQYLQAIDDVYLISVNGLVEWTKNPVPFSEIDQFEPLTCPNSLPEDTCPEIDNSNCHYVDDPNIASKDVYMNICSGKCPDVYPWTGNPYGMNRTLTNIHSKLKKP